MTAIQTITPTSGYSDNWNSYDIDLSAYAGQTIYVGFHDTCYDCYEGWIDLIQFWTHAHNFTYSANEDTITATCGNNGCDLTNQRATLTIAAPALTTYGGTESAEATVTGEIPGVSATTVVYQQGTETLQGAPTAAGTYTASITLTGEDTTGDVTASVTYTIDKADPGTPAASMSSYTYGETASPGIGNFSGNGEVTYYYNTTNSNANGTAWTDSTAASLNAGDYYLYASIAEGDNYNGYTTAAVPFTMNQKEVALIWNTETVTLTYNGQQQFPQATVSGSSLVSRDMGKVDVTVTAKSGDDCTAAGSHTAEATALTGTAAANYKLPSSVSKDFNIAQKDVTITGLSAESKTYDGKANATVTGTVVLNGVVGEEDVNVVDGTAAFVNKNAGTGKTVTFSGYAITGKDVGNYTLTQPAAVKADIAKSASGVTGYQVSFATSNSFSGAKTVTVKNAKTLTTTIKDLKKGTTCYVRFRAYTTKSGMTTYSVWSDTKSIKLSK